MHGFLGVSLRGILGCENTVLTTDAPVPLQTEQTFLYCAFQESLFSLVGVPALSELVPCPEYLYDGCTLITRKQTFILDRTLFSGTTLYTFG